jgi:hypothetical protein
MLADFVLVDLVSQRDAVRVLLRDVDIDNRLEWLKSQGTVQAIEHSPPFPLTYVFESRLGIIAQFFFNDSGDFVFLGDHSTFH